MSINLQLELIEQALITHQINCDGGDGSSQAIIEFLKLKTTLKDQARHREGQAKQISEFVRNLGDLAQGDYTVDLADWRETMGNVGDLLTLTMLEASASYSTGLVAVSVWGRDCDMCESSRLTQIKPTLEDWADLMDRVEESAEGPTSVSILTQDEAKEFKAESRDRAMEAFENGRGANAYSV